MSEIEGKKENGRETNMKVALKMLLEKKIIR